jgi:hypothetical protein
MTMSLKEISLGDRDTARRAKAEFHSSAFASFIRAYEIFSMRNISRNNKMGSLEKERKKVEEGLWR